MEIIINGVAATLAPGTTLAALMRGRGFASVAAVIEYNGEIVIFDKWESVQLQAGDKLEIVTFVGGG